MSNREFMAFVRRPRHIESQDGIILFEDEKHDNYMKRGYWPNVAMYAPIAFLMVYVAYLWSNDA